jgi:hypothetical protein
MGMNILTFTQCDMTFTGVQMVVIPATDMNKQQKEREKCRLEIIEYGLTAKDEEWICKENVLSELINNNNNNNNIIIIIIIKFFLSNISFYMSCPVVVIFINYFASSLCDGLKILSFTTSPGLLNVKCLGFFVFKNGVLNRHGLSRFHRLYPDSIQYSAVGRRGDVTKSNLGPSVT